MTSALLVPGDADAQLRGAPRFAADQVIVDLAGLDEDRKAAAPSVAAGALLETDFGDRLVTVRINPIDVAWAYRDLVDVVEQAGELIDAIVVPQVAAPDDLVFVDTLVGMIEQRLDAEQPIAIEAELADAAALARREQIALASDRLVTLVVDPIGIAASLGAPDPTAAIDRWQPLLLDVLATARAAGLGAVVDVSELSDRQAYRGALVLARSLGYDSGWCNHPVQVDIANDVLS
jgi:citrate lyase beta subunit